MWNKLEEEGHFNIFAKQQIQCPFKIVDTFIFLIENYSNKKPEIILTEDIATHCPSDQIWVTRFSLGIYTQVYT